MKLLCTTTSPRVTVVLSSSSSSSSSPNQAHYRFSIFGGVGVAIFIISLLLKNLHDSPSSSSSSLLYQTLVVSAFSPTTTTTTTHSLLPLVVTAKSTLSLSLSTIPIWLLPQQQIQQSQYRFFGRRHRRKGATTMMATSTKDDDDDDDPTTKTATTMMIDAVTEPVLNNDLSSISLQPTKPIENCAIIGVGVLGTYLLQQIVQHNFLYYQLKQQQQQQQQQNNNNDMTDTDQSKLLRQCVVTGITKTTNNHANILKHVLQNYSNHNEIISFINLRTNNNKNDDDDDNNEKDKYDNIVFCAPPSGFEDSYATAIQDAIDQYWNRKGNFIYTSSGAVYSDDISTISLQPVTTISDNLTTTNTSSITTNNNNIPTPYIVNEQTPVPDVTTSSSSTTTTTTPRIQRLLQAEQVVMNNNGYCLRLAGLYTLDRGPHNYWLTRPSNFTISSSPNGMVNLLHYEDAAYACYQALLVLLSPPPHDDDDNDDVVVRPIKNQIFLISDGHPITRYQICQYAKMASYYKDCTIPQFLVADTNDDTINDKNANNNNLKEGPGKIYDGSYSNQILQWQPKYTSFQQFMMDHA